MKLSKQTSDAVNILLHCKRSDGERVKVGLIAEELDLTKQMALKLANRLSRADLLATVRGPKGGVQLTEVAKTLPLGKIVRRLEAVLHGSDDGARHNPFTIYFDEAFEAFLDVLDQHTLADLASNDAPDGKAKKAANRVKKIKSSPTKGQAVVIAQAAKRSKAGRRDRA